MYLFLIISLHLLLTIPLIIITLYLFFVTIASLFYEKGDRKLNLDKKILVIIPAHNEEKHIKKTIESISESNYDVQNFSICVIADNCKDNTYKVASECSADVFVRDDAKNCGKGLAIDWFINAQRDLISQFDIVIFIDADAVVDNKFLSSVASNFDSHKFVAMQGGNKISNHDENWKTALTALGFASVNHVRSAGLVLLGGSCNLKGNGMAFSTQKLLQYGWPAHSIVEDVEHSAFLALQGEAIDYNDKAIVYSDIPVGYANTVTQRKRWEGGCFYLIKKFAWPYLRKLASTRDKKFLFLLLELLMPPLSIICMVNVVALILFLVLQDTFGIVVSLASILVLLFYVVVSLIHMRASMYVCLSLLMAPFFILMKLPIYLYLMLFGQSTWERTGRE